MLPRYHPPFHRVSKTEPLDAFAQRLFSKRRVVRSTCNRKALFGCQAVLYCNFTHNLEFPPRPQGFSRRCNKAAGANNVAPRSPFCAQLWPPCTSAASTISIESTRRRLFHHPCKKLITGDCAPSYPGDTPVPWFKARVKCSECGCGSAGLMRDRTGKWRTALAIARAAGRQCQMG